MARGRTRGSQAPYEAMDDARAVCQACLVRQACFDYAVAAVELLHGVSGGTSERERRRLRKVGA